MSIVVNTNFWMLWVALYDKSAGPTVLGLVLFEPVGEATLIPFGRSHAFEARQEGSVTMSIDVGDGVCEGTFEFEVAP